MNSNACNSGPEPKLSVAAEDLLMVPDLWASLIFQHEVPDFHSWIWRYLADDRFRRLVILLPAGCGKSTIVSVEHTIYELCKDPNRKIALIQKSVKQSKKVMLTIQRHMAYNKTLNDLYGPFRKSVDGDGFPWSTETLRTANNTDFDEQTNSIHAFGTQSSDVLGYRFDTIKPDDVCTDDNSSTPEARGKLETKLTTEWDKTLIGSKSPRLIMVGTAFAWDDLYLSKEKYAEAVIGPHDWREPDELARQCNPHGYVVIRKDAEVGMTGNPLWVKQLPWEELEQYKKEGIANYWRRLRNVARDPGQAIFKAEAISGEDGYPGCLDRDRVMREREPEWRVLCGADPSSGKNTGASAQFAHVAVGVDPEDSENRVHIVDVFTGPVPIVREGDGDRLNDGVSQVGTIIARHYLYDAYRTYIESNAQQWAWLTATEAADPSLKGAVLPHETTKKKKINPVVGVESMGSLLESGRLRIPYGDDYSRKWADTLIEQFVRYPDFSFLDLVMALWFCVYNLKRRHKAKAFNLEKLKSEARAWRSKSE